MKLSLWFTKKPQAQLVQVRFERAGKSPKDSYRGKSLMYHHDAGLFQWTSAVKAFAALSLETKANLLRGIDEPFELSGEQGSAASALDFAIAKPTSWVVDMFGREQSGKSYARLVFKRENSEQKRPGPVKVFFSKQLLEPGALKIFCEGVELVTESDIRELLKILTLTDKVNRDSRHSSSSHEVVFKAEWFKQLLDEEIQFSLTETYLLDPVTVRLASERIIRHYVEFEKEMKQISTALQQQILPETSRYKKRGYSLEKKEIRSIACSPIAVGALCVLHQLQEGEFNKAEINASYPSSSAIVESGEIESADLAVLSWGASLKLQRSTAAKLFRPVMLLPRSTFGIIVLPHLHSPLEIKNILLGDDPYGYPVEITRRLREYGRIMPGAKNVSASPSEMMMHLDTLGDAAVVGFPLSAIIAKKFKAKILWAHDDALRVGDNVLFVRNNVDAEGVAVAVRNAWFSLLEEPKLVVENSKKIFSDISFINYLYRQAALYRSS